MKTKIFLMLSLSLLWLTITQIPLAAGEKELMVTQKWLKSLGKEHSLQELKSLQTLYLEGIKVTDAGLVHLKELKSLQTLDLMETKVTDTGLVHLKELKSLQSLVLWETKVTDAGLVHLKELKSLQTLVLGRTKVTDAGVADLKEALPGCSIYR